MRPSARLITLILALTTLTIILAVWLSELGLILLPLWVILIVLLVLDLLLCVSPRQLKVQIDTPDQGFVGHALPVTITITPRRGALPSVVEAQFELPSPLICAPEDMAAVHFDEEQKTASIKGKIHLTQRGHYQLAALWLKWPSRLGLFDIITRIGWNKEIAIIPDISPILTGSIQLQMLPLDSGAKDLNIRGDGSEFHQLRDFVPGLDPRSIDWKRSARLRNLVVRETRAERNHQIILCLDSGRLMVERLAGLPKIDRAVTALLALCWASGIAGDLVGFYNFDSRPRLFLPARPGRAAFSRLQSLCAGLSYDLNETNHTLGLTHLASKLTRRSLIIIFSDFVDTITAELMLENISVLARHHLIVYIALTDPTLHHYATPEELSMENVARGTAAQQILQERRLVLDKLGRLGVLCLDTNHEKLTSDLIARYIEIKMREMI